MPLIAPALLAADFARLGEALGIIGDAGCRMVHLDVGDGHFSSDVSFGQPVVESVRRATRLELDVHLLIERPERYVADFAKAGADRLAVHPESTPHLWRTLELIRKSGVKAGIALQPGSPLRGVSDLLGEVDFVSILTADTASELDLNGPPRQAESWALGIAELKETGALRERRGLRFELQAEGDIGLESIPELIDAGADILVTGFAIFQGGQPALRLQEIIEAAGRAIAPNRAESGGV